MESLGDILRRIAVRNSSETTNGVGVAPERTEPEPEACPHCKGGGWVSKPVPLGHPDFGEAFPCRCRQRDDDHQSSALRRYSNLGSLSRVTFANSKTTGPLPDEGSRVLFQQAWDAAAEFAESPVGWLSLAGPSGSGKTHLAAAIANRCIDRGQTSLFIVLADLLDHLRAAYAPDSPITYDELFDQVRQAPVLVLDDVGAQSATPWAREKLLQIFNHRFSAGLPTVITVRGPLQRLDEALRSRIESVDGFSRLYQLGRYNTRLARAIGDLPPEMRRRMTFENFDPRGGRNASEKDRESLQRAKLAAETFAGDPDGWLLLTGPAGSGKTHLAVAVAGYNLGRGRPVFYAFVPTLLDHLRSTFSPDSPIGYDELFEQLQTASLLVLDDLGAESSTPWAEEKLHQIVVQRHEGRLPTVITVALPLDELEKVKPRIASRLVDSMVVAWQPITAPNYRDQRREGAAAVKPPSPPQEHRRPPRY